MKQATPEIMIGTSIANAFANAGYGGGALSAVDSYEEVFYVVLLRTGETGRDSQIEEFADAEAKEKTIGPVVRMKRYGKRVTIALENGADVTAVLGNPPLSIKVKDHNEYICKVFGTYSDADEWVADNT